MKINILSYINNLGFVGTGGTGPPLQTIHYIVRAGLSGPHYSSKSIDLGIQ